MTIGFGMLITFDDGRYDWRASWWLVPVGHALVAVPFVVRTTLPVLRGIDPRLHEAAATLGASPVRAWREVTLPHLWRPLVAARRAGGGHLARRVRRHELPVAHRRRRRCRSPSSGCSGGPAPCSRPRAYALAVILAAATIVVVLLLEPPGDRISGLTRGPARRRSGR